MNDYLLYLANETKGYWWNDSANFADLVEAVTHGAVGVTTNPVLVNETINKCADEWKPILASIPRDLSGSEKAIEIIKAVTIKVASMFEPIYKATNGEGGYVCAQVNPGKSSDRKAMLEMARTMSSWAPNVAVKLPVTAAGLDVLEDCIAEGITITGTVSFTYAQAMAIGDRCEKGRARAAKAGVKPGRCFAVIMVGRIDDYLRDCIKDSGLNIAEEDIIQAGTAIIKRAYRDFAKNGYTAILMPAGLRGAYQVEALAGANMAMSINPKIQVKLPSIKAPYVEHIEEEVDPAVIERLSACPEFIKAYEPDGLKPEQFFSYGCVQKTLAQFVENWGQIEKYPLK